MKNKLNILFFLLVFLIPLARLEAQKEDSIVLSELNQAYIEAKNDSVRLNVLIKLSEAQVLVDVDSAITLAKLALELAIKEKDTLYMGVVHGLLAGHLTIRTQFNEALKNDLKALSFFKKLGDPSLIARIYNDVGDDYANLNMYNQEFENYNKSLEIALKNDLKLEEAIAKFNIGGVLVVMGRLAKARNYIVESMSISREIGDTLGVAYCQHDLAKIALESGNSKKALSILNEAYQLSVNQRSMTLTPQILLTMAQVHTKDKRYNEAEIHYDRALDIYEQLKNELGIAEVYFGKGSLSMQSGNDVAASNYFEQCMVLTQKIGDHELMLRCLKELSMFYELKGNYEYALSLYKKYNNLEDSLFTIKKQMQFSQMQMEYETNKKDMEIQWLHEQEVKHIAQLRNRLLVNIMLGILILFGVVLLLLLYQRSIKRQKNEHKLMVQKELIKSKSEELEGLIAMKNKFFSIISHDLRSPINSLVALLSLFEQDQLTQKEWHELSGTLKNKLIYTKTLMDSLLDWTMLEMETIKIHLEKVELHSLVSANFDFYKGLEEKTIQYVNNVPEKLLVSADRNMINLIIRNLISNAIKFTNNDGEVMVSATEGEAKTVLVSVSDNGIGMTVEQKERLFNDKSVYTTLGTDNETGKGLGLKLSKEFVEKMGGNIWVESVEGKGSIFNFTVKGA